MAAALTVFFRILQARTRCQPTRVYYHCNQQYSIVALTNAAGTLVERYTYSAYGTLGIYDPAGTVRSSSTYANRYTYTGREYDPDLNLYHFRARWYDPATGGFISRDPLGYVDGINGYRRYFGISSNDPTGMFTIEDAWTRHCNDWCTPGRRKAIPYCWMECREKESICEVFKTWVKMEKERGDWWTELPKCPCRIIKERRHCASPSLWGGPSGSYSVDEWIPPGSDWGSPIVPSTAESTLHPGAALSMRTKNGPFYNQCIYDSEGILMTRLPSAGTVDYEKSGLNPQHYYQDVYPIIVANFCDGGILHNFWGMASGFIRMRNPAGENVKMYYTVRPHWAEDCSDNPSSTDAPIGTATPTITSPSLFKRNLKHVRCY